MKFDRMPWETIELILQNYFWKGDYVIKIPSEDWRPQIIAESHDLAIGGNKGILKMYERVREGFCWKGLKEDVQSFTKTCDSCQKKK